MDRLDTVKGLPETTYRARYYGINVTVSNVHQQRKQMGRNDFKSHRISDTKKPMLREARIRSSATLNPKLEGTLRKAREQSERESVRSQHTCMDNADHILQVGDGTQRR